MAGYLARRSERGKDQGSLGLLSRGPAGRLGRVLESSGKLAAAVAEKVAAIWGEPGFA
jgi:hypothetical protein